MSSALFILHTVFISVRCDLPADQQLFAAIIAVAASLSTIALLWKVLMDVMRDVWRFRRSDRRRVGIAVHVFPVQGHKVMPGAMTWRVRGVGDS
jgi:hypothetical protein